MQIAGLAGLVWMPDYVAGMTQTLLSYRGRASAYCRAALQHSGHGRGAYTEVYDQTLGHRQAA